ncbi:hypothetical protein LIER_17534 [Lithospermum erythrorhizon]|uniref:Uncharacterized protein n=1 Tax=Lithospermum erythrorhizon TaxID=34254 RepID=A0AAV3QAX9_LITER
MRGQSFPAARRRVCRPTTTFNPFLLTLPDACENIPSYIGAQFGQQFKISSQLIKGNCGNSAGFLGFLHNLLIIEIIREIGMGSSQFSLGKLRLPIPELNEGMEGQRKGRNVQANERTTPVKKSFANLFSGNRNPSKGLSFEYTKPVTGMVELEKEDAKPIVDKWGFCLIGSFTGRFLRPQSMYDIVKSWGVQCKVIPYSRGLAKIASRLGKPLYSDQVISEYSRATYARILVEVDVWEKPIFPYDVKMPNGEIYKQYVSYEN